MIENDGFFVTTGQQPALFGGPLYTVYKALTAIRLADALERTLRRPVAPVFWIASDDHDWTEANHIQVLDRDNRIRRIELPERPGAPSVSLASRPLPPDIESALDELAQVLPDTEFKDDVLGPTRNAFEAGRSMAAAFADLLTSLFGDAELLLLDAGDAVVKQQAAPVLRQALTEAETQEARVAERTEELRAAGYDAQVAVLEGATNVFLDDATHGRQRLYRAEDGWRRGRDGELLEADAVLALLEREPDRFSPNVLMRPVVESALLPTLAYVAGPGELRYYAQIGCLYPAYDMEMPLVYPRTSITLIEGKVRKVLDKFDLSVDDFTVPVHELAARVMREELPDAVKRALTDLRRALNDGAERLAEAAVEIDPTLEGPVYGVRNAAHVELSDLEKKITRHLKDQNEIGVRQLEKARANLYPDGSPQERVFNIHAYLVRYGPAFVDELAARIEVDVETEAPAWAGVDCG